MKSKKELWHADEVNRMELAKLLKNPVLLTAIDVVLDSVRPRPSRELQSNPVASAASYHTQIGYGDAFYQLQLLAEEPAKTTSPLPDAWAHAAQPKLSTNE